MFGPLNIGSIFPTRRSPQIQVRTDRTSSYKAAVVEVIDAINSASFSRIKLALTSLSVHDHNANGLSNQALHAVRQKACSSCAGGLETVKIMLADLMTDTDSLDELDDDQRKALTTLAVSVAYREVYEQRVSAMLTAIQPEQETVQARIHYVARQTKTAEATFAGREQEPLHEIAGEDVTAGRDMLNVSLSTAISEIREDAESRDAFSEDVAAVRNALDADLIQHLKILRDLSDLRATMDLDDGGLPQLEIWERCLDQITSERGTPDIEETRAPQLTRRTVEWRVLDLTANMDNSELDAPVQALRLSQQIMHELQDEPRTNCEHLTNLLGLPRRIKAQDAMPSYAAPTCGQRISQWPIVANHARSIRPVTLNQLGDSLVIMALNHLSDFPLPSGQRQMLSLFLQLHSNTLNHAGWKALRERLARLQVHPLKRVEVPATSGEPAPAHPLDDHLSSQIKLFTEGPSDEQYLIVPTDEDLKNNPDARAELTERVFTIAPGKVRQDQSVVPKAVYLDLGRALHNPHTVAFYANGKRYPGPDVQKDITGTTNRPAQEALTGHEDSVPPQTVALVNHFINWLCEQLDISHDEALRNLILHYATQSSTARVNTLYPHLYTIKYSEGKGTAESFREPYAKLVSDSRAELDNNYQVFSWWKADGDTARFDFARSIHGDHLLLQRARDGVKIPLARGRGRIDSAFSFGVTSRQGMVPVDDPENFYGVDLVPVAPQGTSVQVTTPDGKSFTSKEKAFAWNTFV